MGEESTDEFTEPEGIEESDEESFFICKVCEERNHLHSPCEDEEEEKAISVPWEMTKLLEELDADSTR